MNWPQREEESSGPLSDVRVLDLSRILAGPFSTQVMADLGADIIKVERPGGGDETRRWGPPFAASGDAAYFYACNRGRRSVIMDLRVAEDRELLLELVEDADILVENFLPGAMARLGLADDVLKSRNPRLVHGVISGYGTGSSRESWAALDFVIQAHAGILSITGPSPDSRVKAGVPIADLSAGLFATIGLLAALRRAERTGVGGRVEVSLAESCGALLVNQAMNYLIGGIEPTALGNTHPNVAPYQIVRARDRDLALAATSDLQFERLCDVVGVPQLASDERFCSNAHRVANRNDLESVLEQRLAERSAADWVQVLNEAGVAAALVNGLGEMLDDPDTRAGLVAEMDHEGGTLRQLRTPIRLDGRPLPLASPPPRYGAHDAEIRAALAGGDSPVGEPR